MRNLGLKLLSIAIALFLANYVYHTSNNTQISFLVPIEISNLPADKVIVWPLNRQTTVTIKGASHLVSRIAASPPGFKIDVPVDTKNHFSATLSSGDLGLPSSVDVVSVSPSEFEFTLDDLASKEIPVVVPQLGDLDANLVLNSFSFEPKKVTISGPETEVRQFETVETRQVDLRSIVEDAQIQLPIRKPGIQTKISPEQVTVVIDVESVVLDRIFDGLAVEVRSEQGQALSLNPTQVQVVVKGPRQVVTELKDSEVVPYVRLSTSVVSGEVVDVMVELPAGITLVSVRPAKVAISMGNGSKSASNL